MTASRGRIIRNTRAGRRIFALKARPSMRNLTSIYVQRGGGYL